MNANFRNFALWVIIGLVLIALFNLFQNSGQRVAGRDIPYSQFLTEVDQGRVHNVIISGQQIAGIYSDGGAFQTFAQIHLLTRGGPAGATNVVVYSIYRDAFFNFQTGYASAQAVILFLILLALTAFQFGVLERRVYYS